MVLSVTFFQVMIPRGLYKLAVVNVRHDFKISRFQVTRGRDQSSRIISKS